MQCILVCCWFHRILQYYEDAEIGFKGSLTYVLFRIHGVFLKKNFGERLKNKLVTTPFPQNWDFMILPLPQTCLRWILHPNFAICSP